MPDGPPLGLPFGEDDVDVLPAQGQGEHRPGGAATDDQNATNGPTHVAAFQAEDLACRVTVLLNGVEEKLVLGIAGMA